MAEIELSRAEPRDLLILLERLEGKARDVDVFFQLDTFIRILMERIFPNLPSEEG